MPNACTILLFCVLAVVIAGCETGIENSPSTPLAAPTQELPGLQNLDAEPAAVTPIRTHIIAPIAVSTPVATVTPTDIPTATPEPTVVPVEQIMTGHVVEALARNPFEIETL